MPEIISRKEARAKGLKRYFTGKPCKWGHVAEFTTKKSICVICNRLAQKEYSQTEKAKSLRRKRSSKDCSRLKEWIKNNPEKAQQSILNWKAKHPDKVRKHRLKRYYEGPSNPTGEKQWLRKSQAILRTTKRIFKNRNREVTRSPEVPM